MNNFLNHTSMKRILIFGILLSISLFNSQLKAQDLIVTAEGDSLNCLISKIEIDYLYFSFKYKNEVRNTLIPISQVKTFRKNYFNVPELPQQIVLTREMFSTLRFAVNGGFSNRTAKLPENLPGELKQYTKDLVTGNNFGLDFTYFLSKSSGIGLKYSGHFSSNSIDRISVTTPSGTVYGKMSDQIAINFFGPIYTSRYISPSTNSAFLFSIGAGYLGFKNDAVFIDNFYFNGSTFGICFDIGWDLKFHKNIAIGFNIAFIGGSLSEIEISDGSNSQTIKFDKDNYENIGRIDFTVGFRILN